ncbi:MAG: hypothetical protein FWG51_03390, partial [Firmicutes bacterium]|nr:hypothetical protein [Bacillota bacterium]
NVPLFFTKSVHDTERDPYYRPLLNISFFTDAFFWKEKPFGYHLTNILLHIASVFLIFLLLSRLNFNKKIVFVLALLFAAHPAFVQAVVWIPGRNDTLLAVAVTASLIFIFDYFNENKKNIYKLFLFVFFFVAALFIKETAVVMIVAVPLFVLLFCRNAGRKDRIALFLLLFLLCLGFIAAQTSVVLKENAVSLTVSYVIQNILKSMPIFLSYIEKIIIPIRINIIDGKIYFDWLTFIALCFFLTPVIASFFFRIGRIKIILFGLFWFVIFILPTFVMPAFLVSCHRLYVPVIGVLLMFAEFLSSFANKIKVGEKYIVVLLFIIAVSFAFISYIDAKKFQNRAIFIINALSEDPVPYLIRCKAAEYYFSSGMLTKAENEIKKIETEEFGTYHLRILGHIYTFKKEYDKAINIFETLSEMNRDEIAIKALIDIYLIHDEYEKALLNAEKLFNKYPDNEKYKNIYMDVRQKIYGTNGGV